MNRRQFIAGLMASTVATPVPILKPRSAGWSTRAVVTAWDIGRPGVDFAKLWYDVENARMAIDRITAIDFYKMRADAYEPVVVAPAVYARLQRAGQEDGYIPWKYIPKAQHDKGI